MEKQEKLLAALSRRASENQEDKHLNLNKKINRTIIMAAVTGCLMWLGSIASDSELNNKIAALQQQNQQLKLLATHSQPMTSPVNIGALPDIEIKQSQSEKKPADYI